MWKPKAPQRKRVSCLIKLHNLLESVLSSRFFLFIDSVSNIEKSDQNGSSEVELKSINNELHVKSSHITKPDHNNTEAENTIDEEGKLLNKITYSHLLESMLS